MWSFDQILRYFPILYLTMYINRHIVGHNLLTRGLSYLPITSVEKKSTTSNPPTHRIKKTRPIPTPRVCNRVTITLPNTHFSECSPVNKNLHIGLTSYSALKNFSSLLFLLVFFFLLDWWLPPNFKWLRTIPNGYAPFQMIDVICMI